VEEHQGHSGPVCCGTISEERSSDQAGRKGRGEKAPTGRGERGSAKRRGGDCDARDARTADGEREATGGRRMLGIRKRKQAYLYLKREYNAWSCR